MQQLKTILMTFFVSISAFFMFFIGLGLMLFILIVSGIMSLFGQSKSGSKMRSKWKSYHQYNRAAKSGNQEESHKVIEGQYTVIDQ